MNSDNLCGEVTAAAETHNSEETKWECYCITFTTPPPQLWPDETSYVSK